MEPVEGWILVLAVWGVVALVPVIGFTILQVFLSKKDNKWLGLILPIASVVPFAQYFLMMLPIHDWEEARAMLFGGIISPIYLLIVYCIVRLWRKRRMGDILSTQKEKSR